MDNKRLIADVVVPKSRARPLGNIVDLAASIRNVGLINPITVTPACVLVSGLHRLEACRLLGWKEIPVSVVTLDGLKLELAELDENLCRNELTSLERGEHLARRKEIYEALHPQAKKGVAGARASNKAQGNEVGDATATVSFASSTAKSTGLSERTIQRDVQIAERIAPAVKEQIRSTPLADKKRDLVDLARETNPATQAAIVERVTSGKAKTVREAKAQIEPPAVRDSIGQVVDPTIAPAFTIIGRRASAVALGLKRALLEWKGIEDELAANDGDRAASARAFGFLRNNIEKIRPLMGAIDAGAPYAVCPYCRGKGECEGCQGSGWVNEDGFNSAPPEMRKAAR